jgi:hypothetical protein
MEKESKVTVNNQPLVLFLDKEKSKEADQVFREQTRKYWSGVRGARYSPHGLRNGKVKCYEDWEIFVYLLDNTGIDIADLDIDQLHALWKTWKKFRRI